MQRLTNVDKWFVLEQGKTLNFENVAPRKIRLDVNAEAAARLYYVDTEGQITFLAAVQGRDVVEFYNHGEFGVTAEGADVWLYTIDGEDISFSIPEAETFTKLVERRTRNPEVEMMQYMMKANMQAMMDAQRGEMARLLDQRDAAARASAAQPAPASDGGAVGAESEPAKSAGADGQPAKADGGDGTKASK